MQPTEAINATTQIDATLVVYKNKILFPEKLEKANVAWGKLGLPKRKRRKKTVLLLQ